MKNTLNLLSKTEILGIKITKDKYLKIFQYISKSIEGYQKIRIVTPNPEIVVKAQGNKIFKDILNNAEIAIPDGRGLIWASKILKLGLTQQITGIDLMLDLCKKAVFQKWTVFLLGGKEKIGKIVKQKLEEKYPQLCIIGIYEGDPSEESDKKSREEIKKIIGKKKINLLFVAYGASKQEMWIARNIEYLPVNVCMGVGGAFNYIAGRSKRASQWLRNLGFEWLYRLFTEPWRWRRQLRLIEFGLLVFAKKLKILGIDK